MTIKAIAHGYGAAVTVLHVTPAAAPPPYPPGAPVVLPPLAETDRDGVVAAVRRFADAEVGTQVPIDVELREGPVAAEILRHSMSAPTDLIVMGTHGRSGFERLFLGSVTEKVLRTATCPVLTVPRGMDDVVPVSKALYARILCAVDFSDCSVRALHYAVWLAQQTNARLTVAHVVERPADLPAGVHETVAGGPRTADDYVAEAVVDRRARLNDLVPENVRASCTVDVVVAVGSAYRELLSLARTDAHDLIVLGIHGRGAIDLLLVGSTAQHVVRQASCPVLTLRSA